MLNRLSNIDRILLNFLSKLILILQSNIIFINSTLYQKKLYCSIELLCSKIEQL